jgi:O-antigen/teichoic acid export membrane protein
VRKFPALSPTSWLTTKTVFSQVFAILLFAIQAPVLGPRAFGLVSIVSVFVGFCEFVLGEAAAEALISIRNIETAHFDTMNTLNVLVSLVCGAAAFIGANAVARWFGDPELASILRWMALLPVISALAAGPTAATKREMQFQPLALRSMVSLFAGGIVGLVLTLTGFGVWALVWQAIVTRLVASVVLWLAVPLRLRFGFSRVRLAELLPFAVPVLLSRTMAFATGQFPRLIFGLYWGPTELGIFGLAGRLCDVLLEVALVPRYAVARVELRRFASDRDGLLEAVPKLLTNVSVICFPLSIGGAAVVPTLFHAWLDARWYAGIVPAQLMMLMCAPFVTHYCIGATLLALNFQFAEALSSAVQSVATVIVVIVFAPLGLLPATAAFAARPLLLLPLPALLLRAKCAVPARILFTAQRPALIAALTMGVGVTVLRMGLEPVLRSVLLLPLLIAAGAMLYVGAIALLLPSFARQFVARFAAASGGGKT